MAAYRGIPGQTAVSNHDAWVRQAQSDDLPAILRLLATMHDEHTPPADDERTRLFAECLAQADRWILVSGLDAAVLGTVDLVVVQNLSRGCSPWSTVENLVVDPAFRRRGIATVLMQEALRLARLAGCYKLQLVSNEYRSAAHDFYVDLGFDAPVRGFRQYLD